MKRMWLVGLMAWMATCAGAETLQLELRIPGSNLSAGSSTDKSNLKGWYALALRDGNLVVEAATKPIPSNLMSVSGRQADRLLAGKYQPTANKAYGLSVEAPADAVVLARIEKNDKTYEKIALGTYPSALSSVILQEGWRAAAEINGKKWQFFTAHQKRPDGKLLAGSLEIKGERVSDNTSNNTSNTSKVILDSAAGMAFQRQELLWLGDLNQDGEPDLLLKRTWITGEIDFVMVLSPKWGNVYFDPDLPAHYYSSGVEPDSNNFTWSRGQPTPEPITFSNKGSFSFNQSEWEKQLEGHDKSIPKILADRQLKLDGENVRIVLEYLPRSTAKEEGSSGMPAFWGGDVLVRINFRGKTQVITEVGTPDTGLSFMVGLVKGKPAIKMGYEPHYNNGFTHYWLWNESEMRFRRVLIVHSQGC